MRKLSKILALVLVLMMAFAVISAFSFTTSAANIPAGTKLYLVPSANWNQSNARFAAYFFGNGEAWVSMTKVAGESNLYEVTVPAGSWTNVIFCRMNPSASANNWNNKWNQTSDLTYNGTSNCYTVKEGTWDKGGGTWSTYGSSCVHTNVGAAATCTKDQLCLDCGDPVASALGHTYNSAHLCTRCNEQAAFTVAGSGAHLGTEWDTGNTANDMTYADGVYTKVYTNVAAGSYLLKVVRDHDWGTAYPDADKAYTVATAGSTVTVTLKGTAVTIDVVAPHVCEFVAGEVVAPTYEADGYTVYSCTCGKTENRDVVPALTLDFPEVVVTPIVNENLTFALNFGIKDVETFSEEYVMALLEKYGDMYVDYRLTIEGLTADKVVFNANGEVDGYLGGQYDEWSENWVYVPFENVEIPNNGSLMIMEYAAKMMGKEGLRQTLAEIVTVVVNFDCGVYFTPEFLAANPDMKVTLELIVFTEDAEGNKTLLNDAPVATNEFVAPHIHSWSEATCTELSKCECGETQGELVPHNFKRGACTVCGEVDADYVAPAPSDLVMDFTTWDPYAEGTYEAGAVQEYNKYFTFIHNSKSRIDGNTKEFSDGFYGTQRFNFGGKTEVGKVPTKSALKITVPCAGSVTVWWVSGGNDRLLVLLDAEGNQIAIAEESVKDGRYVTTFEIPAAGVYYLGNKDGNNYWFQVALTLNCTHTWVDATCTAPKTCSVCGATEGEVAPHNYFYNVCLGCGAANPHFIYNFTTVGENKLVCNEYHLVDTDTHKKPYQFTLVTIPEDGLYIFTADATKLGVFIYTIEINTEGADFSVGGASWAAVTFGQAELKAGQYYLGFIFHEGVGEYDLTITKHEHEFVEGNCACGAEDPNYVPPHEHEFVEGKCECGETDPDYVAPEEPKDDDSVVELTFFQKILAWFKQLIARLLAIFKK